MGVKDIIGGAVAGNEKLGEKPEQIAKVAKEKASVVAKEISNNKEVKSKVNQAIDAVEKKVKVDLPDVDGIKKLLD